MTYSNFENTATDRIEIVAPVTYLRGKSFLLDWRVAYLRYFGSKK